MARLFVMLLAAAIAGPALAAENLAGLGRGIATYVFRVTASKAVPAGPVVLPIESSKDSSLSRMTTSVASALGLPAQDLLFLGASYKAETVGFVPGDKVAEGLRFAACAEPGEGVSDTVMQSVIPSAGATIVFGRRIGPELIVIAMRVVPHGSPDWRERDPGSGDLVDDIMRLFGKDAVMPHPYARYITPCRPAEPVLKK